MKIVYSSLGGSWKALQGRKRWLFFALVLTGLLLLGVSAWGFYLLLRWAFIRSFLLGLFVVFFILPALGRMVFMGLMLYLSFFISLFSGPDGSGGGGRDHDDGVVDVQAKILS
jgi:hypothetical protein